MKRNARIASTHATVLTILTIRSAVSIRCVWERPGVPKTCVTLPKGLEDAFYLDDKPHNVTHADASNTAQDCLFDTHRNG